MLYELINIWVYSKIMFSRTEVIDLSEWMVEVCGVRLGFVLVYRFDVRCILFLYYTIIHIHIILLYYTLLFLSILFLPIFLIQIFILYVSAFGYTYLYSSSQEFDPAQTNGVDG